jgi:PAS domain S-box-containing protein
MSSTGERLRRSALFGYGLAFVSVGAALVLSIVLLHFDSPLPFTGFALTVIGATFWYSCTKPGIVAVLLSTLIRSYFFQPRIVGVPRMLYDSVFLAFALFMTWITRERNELKVEVGERTAELTEANEKLKIEIEERKQAEEAVKQGEDRLRLVLDTTPALIHTARPDGYLDYFNQRWLNYAGHSLEDMQGWAWTATIHPEDVEAVVDKWRASVASGEPFLREARVRRADGEYRWMLHHQVPLRDEHSNIVKWYGSSIDIEDRKRAERQSWMLIDAIPQQIWSGPPDGTIDYCNDRWRSYMGLGLEDLRGDGWQTMLHPDDQERVLRAWHESVANGTPYEQEERHRGADGRYRWFLSRAVPLRDDDARILRWYGTNTVIENQKQAEEELRQARERIESILNSVSDTFILFDRQWRYLYLNDAAVRATRQPLKEILGRSLWELFPDVVGTELDRQFHRAMEQRVHVEFNFHFLQPGIDQWWEIRTYPAPEGLSVYATEITERKRADEQLRRLSGEILRSQDEERRRIARDLHDSTGQNLVALATMLGRLNSSIPSTEQESRTLLTESKALAEQCIREIRTLSYVLHPPVLDEAGLEDAIRDYVAGFTERSGILVNLEVSPRFGRMPRDVELALFRVVQESLTNVQRHSGSLQARITLVRTADEVTLEISDTGRQTSDKEFKRDKWLPFEVGVGIPSMRERVKLIGGRITIATDSRGTSVRVTLPGGGQRREETTHSDS